MSFFFPTQPTLPVLVSALFHSLSLEILKPQTVVSRESILTWLLLFNRRIASGCATRLNNQPETRINEQISTLVEGKPREMIGVEVFCAGGMSLGAEWAGIEVQIAVEIKPAACITFAKNYRRTKLIAGDIRDVTKIELSRRDGEVIVFGGPPCQGFSTSNQRTRTKENPKNWLFLEFLRIVDIVEPEWGPFKNVAGILQTDRGSFVRKFDAQLKRRGYRTIRPIKRGRFWRSSATHTILHGWSAWGPSPRFDASSEARVDDHCKSSDW